MDNKEELVTITLPANVWAETQKVLENWVETQKIQEDLRKELAAIDQKYAVVEQPTPTETAVYNTFTDEQAQSMFTDEDRIRAKGMGIIL
jgi:hypothetical protein